MFPYFFLLFQIALKLVMLFYIRLTQTVLDRSKEHIILQVKTLHAAVYSLFCTLSLSSVSVSSSVIVRSSSGGVRLCLWIAVKETRRRATDAGK